MLRESDDENWGVVPDRLVGLVRGRPNSVRQSRGSPMVTTLGALNVDLSDRVKRFFLDCMVAFFRKDGSGVRLLSVIRPDSRVRTYASFVRRM